jgi:hypothetical protein
VRNREVGFTLMNGHRAPNRPASLNCWLSASTCNLMASIFVCGLKG